MTKKRRPLSGKGKTGRNVPPVSISTVGMTKAELSAHRRKMGVMKQKAKLQLPEHQARMKAAGKRMKDRQLAERGRSTEPNSVQMEKIFAGLGVDDRLRFKKDEPPVEAPALAKTAPAVVADEAVRKVLAAERRLAQMKARDGLIDFTLYTMPSVDDPADVSKSRYTPLFYHRAVANALEAMERGEILRLIIVLPPRHGKSELCSRRFIPWFEGRDPYRSTIFATYSDDFAGDFGRDVRGVIEHPNYPQVFPACALARGSKASDRLQTTDGGLMFFVGRGGATTGRGADLIVVDDPFKDHAEASSPTIREQLWQWYTRVLSNRLLSDMGRILITTTRWHEDDLVGRLTDPQNPNFRADEAEKWSILHLPAIAEDNDPINRKKGEPLWPQKFGTTYLNGIRNLNANGFSALYQGRPSPEEGAFFKRADFVPYTSILDLPDKDTLTYFGASDHAVSTKQQNDRSCIGCVGVDQNDEIWVLPDVDWSKIPTDVQVEAMLRNFRTYRPTIWWAESENISKSIGPFLRKRMSEERTYAYIEEVTPSKDKMTRAQAIKARFAMRKVHVPVFASWWAQAEDEMLKFPNGTHDDFCDWIALIGRGLDRLNTKSVTIEAKSEEPPRGTGAWIAWTARRERKGRLMLEGNRGGW